MADDLLIETSPLLPEVEVEIKKSEAYQTILSLFEVIVRNPKIKSDDLQSEIECVLNESGYKQKIQNLVYHYLVKNELLDTGNDTSEKEPVAYIQKAQINWEQRILKSLNTMCNDLGISLSRKRPVSEQKELESKWTALGSEEMDLSQFRPVYSSRDFLDVLCSIQNPNLSASGDDGPPVNWGCIKVPFHIQSLKEMGKAFEELAANITHLGVDDCPPASKDSISNFVQERMVLGKKVIRDNSVLLAREYCKRGCTQSLRAEMWCIILGVDVGNPDRLRFEHLKSCVFQHDLMIDKLFFKDVRLTAANDDQYFVFEDMLYQVLLCFSRDVVVLSHFKHSCANAPRGKLRNKQSQEEAVLTFYPPNGVIPFHGFAMYVAPLCYMYDDPVTLYFVFREFYCRLFFRLHSVSSHSQGILYLCLMFERLLQEREPELVQHFITKGIQPLKIVLRWLMRAFSGYLSAEQTLLLWDRILAYNSLQILPILSVAIFSFRSEILIKADTQATAESSVVPALLISRIFRRRLQIQAMLSDISCLKVIPLLQQILGAGA